MLQRLHIYFLASIVISGCSIGSKEKPSDSKAYAIAQTESIYVRNKNSVRAQKMYLEELLDSYSKVNRLEDVLHTHISLAIANYKLNDQKNASLHLHKAMIIHDMSEDKSGAYMLRMTEGIINNNTKAFEQALKNTKKNSEKALAYARLKQVDKALALKASLGKDKDNLAYVYYAYAREKSNLKYAQKAMSLYSSQENSAGMAKSLVLLARLNKDNNSVFNDYIIRAQVMLDALDEVRTKIRLQKEINKLCACKNQNKSNK